MELFLFCFFQERDGPRNEDNSNRETILLPVKKSKHNKRPNYENMSGPDDDKVANTAQIKLDKKYRYVRDPTETMERQNKKNVRMTQWFCFTSFCALCDV